jgi:hypothetical protein
MENRKRIGELKVGDLILRKTSSGKAYTATVKAINAFTSDNPAIFGANLFRVYFSPRSIESTYFNESTVASFSGPAHLSVAIP